MLTRFSDIHIEGGIYFTLPILISLLINLAIIGYSTYLILSKKEVSNVLIEIIKQIGSFAAVWGTLFTIYGLWNIFDAIEASEDGYPIQVISGGLKTALITVIYGLVVFIISMFAYILLKLGVKNSNSNKLNT